MTDIGAVAAERYPSACDTDEKYHRIIGSLLKRRCGGSDDSLLGIQFSFMSWYLAPERNVALFDCSILHAA